MRPLQLVGPVEDPSLTFISFIGFTLMAALGLRFGVYAFWNRRHTELESQAVLWEYLLFVGLAGGTYGVLGVVDVITVYATPFRDGVLLWFLLLLALTMREVYVNSALSNAGPEADERARLRRTVELGFVLFVASVVFAAGLVGDHPVLTGVEGVGAAAMGAYGGTYGRRQIRASRVTGTMIDTLLRHLLPVLAFGALVLVVDLAVLGGLSPRVSAHVQVVFVIMTATALMTATIKLRQNLAGL